MCWFISGDGNRMVRRKPTSKAEPLIDTLPQARPRSLFSCCTAAFRHVLYDAQEYGRVPVA